MKIGKVFQVFVYVILIVFLIWLVDSQGFIKGGLLATALILIVRLLFAWNAGKLGALWAFSRKIGNYVTKRDD